MQPVTFAIIGCGKIGTRHAAKLQTVAGAKLAAVCDIIPERSQSLGQQYGCLSFASLQDLLAGCDVDYINVCTPSGLHTQHSITALNAGKNVLCEKPMALKESDAHEMVEAARRNKKSLFIVKQNRFNPPVALVSRLAKNGILGKPLLCVVNMYWSRDNAYYASESWRGTHEFERSTLFSQVSHFADLMLMFMGKPKTVYAMMGTKNHDIEIDDTGIVTVEFQNGAFGSLNYTTCAAQKNLEGSVTLFYTNGTIKIGGEHLNAIEHFNVNGMDSYDLGESTPDGNDYGTYKGSASNHDSVFKAIVAMEQKDDRSKDFIEKLVAGEEGVVGVRFMEKAVESAQSGVVVEC